MSDVPYREPAPKPEQETEYFVKMKEGSDERGPYALDALRSSYRKQLLGPTALVRTTESAEWKTLRALLEGNPWIPHLGDMKLGALPQKRRITMR
jgi:hypothetical protein